MDLTEWDLGNLSTRQFAERKAETFLMNISHGIQVQIFNSTPRGAVKESSEYRDQKWFFRWKRKLRWIKEGQKILLTNHPLPYPYFSINTPSYEKTEIEVKCGVKPNFILPVPSPWWPTCTGAP